MISTGILSKGTGSNACFVERVENYNKLESNTASDKVNLGQRLFFSLEARFSLPHFNKPFRKSPIVSSHKTGFPAN